jgi:uncharacterized protein YbjT (DUF2867 family)
MIQATRPVLRSYVAINELMSVVFGALTDGKTGAILFDTAGDRIYEMADIAEAVGEALGRRCGMDRPPRVDGPPDRYIGDGAVYRDLRHRFVVESVDFSRQVRDTARFMADFVASF